MNFLKGSGQFYEFVEQQSLQNTEATGATNYGSLNDQDVVLQNGLDHSHRGEISELISY